MIGRAPLTSLVLVAVIGAGCSDDTPERRGTGTGTGASKQASARDKAVRFAECIRENGVGDFPDPDASGEFVYGISVTPAVWKQAVDACKALQPPGTFSSERDPEEQEAGLRFAECMRENGVEDFPDPIDGEPLVDTNRIPSSATEGGMAVLNAAMETCRDLSGKAAGR